VAALALADEAFEHGDATTCPIVEGCYLIRALILCGLGRPDEALTLVAQGDAVLDSLGAPIAAHATLQAARSLAHSERGETELAREAAWDYVRQARATANPSLLAGALSTLARVTWRGAPAAALEMVDESIRLTDEGASGVNLGYSLGIRALLEGRAGQLGPAVSDLRRAIRSSRDKGDWYMVATTIERVVLVLSDVGRLDGAALAAGAVTDGALGNLGILPKAERAEVERTVERLRAELGPARFAALAGQASMASRERATELIVSALDQLISESGSGRWPGSA
jgi:hypothetical protein